jgi:hypothetical protein
VGQERLPVRKIREVLRLKAEGVSDRQIGVAIGSARSTVQECLRRAREAGVSWPLPSHLDETALHAQLYRRPAPVSVTRRPDFPYLHAELRRRGVTRLLLWEEYKTAHPQGWQYSVFCDQYRRWLATQELSLRQDHLPGGKLFVDYASQTVPVTDRHTGRDSRRADFRRRARLLQLHVCRSDLDPEFGGLARRACAGVGVFRRRAPRDSARQPQERRSQGPSLRARTQPRVLRLRRTLRSRHPAGAYSQASRQGEGRVRCAHRGALDSRAAAQPYVLLARRSERGDRHTARAAQHAPVQEDRRHTPIAL